MSQCPSKVNIFITNSLSFGNNKGGFTLLCESDSRLAVTNCTSYDNGAGMLIPDYMSYDDIGDIVVTNFISAGNDCSFDFVNGDPTGYEFLVISYSDFWDTIPEANGYGISSFMGPGVIFSDPQFVDTATPDLHLRALSPCRDGGTETSAVAYGAVTDDYDGVRRPKGTAYDMGAFEYYEMPWSPVSLQPVVATAMSKVVMLWHGMGPYLSESADEGLFAMAEQVQAYIELSATMANPVAASGGLAKALLILEEMESIFSKTA